MRLIHLLDPFWSCWFRAKYHEGKWEHGVPPWAHGFERGRRREDAILVAQLLPWRLTKAGHSHCRLYFDMANAFARTRQTRLKEATQKVVPNVYTGFCEQRHTNSIVTIGVGDQEKNFQAAEA